MLVVSYSFTRRTFSGRSKLNGSQWTRRREKEKSKTKGHMGSAIQRGTNITSENELNVKQQMRGTVSFLSLQEGLY